MLTLSHDDLKLELDFESETEDSAHAEWTYITAGRFHEVNEWAEKLLDGPGGQAQDGLNVQWDNTTMSDYRFMFRFIVDKLGVPDVRKR